MQNHIKRATYFDHVDLQAFTCCKKINLGFKKIVSLLTTSSYLNFNTDTPNWIKVSRIPLSNSTSPTCWSEGFLPIIYNVYVLFYLYNQHKTEISITLYYLKTLKLLQSDIYILVANKSLKWPTYSKTFTTCNIVI